MLRHFSKMLCCFPAAYIGLAVQRDIEGFVDIVHRHTCQFKIVPAGRPAGTCVILRNQNSVVGSVYSRPWSSATALKVR